MTKAKNGLSGTSKKDTPSTKQIPNAEIGEVKTTPKLEVELPPLEMPKIDKTPTEADKQGKGNDSPSDMSGAIPEFKSSENFCPLKEGIDFDAQPKTAEDFKEFEGKEDSLIPVTGEENAKALELSKEDNLALLRKQQEEQERAERISDATVRFNNGSNIWRLISQTLNPIIRSENTVMAMQIGRTRGVMVMIKDGNDYKMNITSLYIDNGVLEENDGKWFLK